MNLIYGGYKLRNPYTKQSSLAIERRLNSTTDLSISYLGRPWSEAADGHDTNLAAPTRTATYTIYNANGIKSGHVHDGRLDGQNGRRLWAHLSGGKRWRELVSRAESWSCNKRMSRSSICTPPIRGRTPSTTWAARWCAA
jgi:hypothetical protein